MHKKAKIVVTTKVFNETLEFLSRYCEVNSNQTERPLSRSELLKRCGDAEGVIVFMPDHIDSDFIKQCKNLRVISGALRGADNIDSSFCSNNGIAFAIIPNLLAQPTAELAVGLMINLSRNMLSGDNYARSTEFKGWSPRFYGSGLCGKSLGILGMGQLGKALVKLVHGFECEISYFDKMDIDSSFQVYSELKKKGLDEVLSCSDFVVNMLPLTNDTHHLINADKLRLFKQGSFLINVGRGSTVCEQAVASALLNNKLSGYAADVFEFEDWALTHKPSSIESGLLNSALNTFFTPHIGSAVTQARKEIEMSAAKNLLSLLGICHSMS